MPWHRAIYLWWMRTRFFENCEEGWVDECAVHFSNLPRTIRRDEIIIFRRRSNTLTAHASPPRATLLRIIERAFPVSCPLSPGSAGERVGVRGSIREK